MSQENVEVVRRVHDAFNRRDFDDAVRHLDPAFELHPAILALDQGGQYRGPDGARKFWDEITEVWEALTVESTETIQGPDDRVLAVEQWRASGRDGLEIDFEVLDLYRFRDGRIVRIDGFTDRAEALEAAGLSE
jgi:ketosteroid isomerase-like protein